MGTMRVDDIVDSAGTGPAGFSQGLNLTAGKFIKTFGLSTSAQSANYTITDTDGVGTVLMTTSSTNRTVTLPTATANTGRIITVKKVDSGTGTLTLTEEGTDLIDGYSSVVAPLQYDFITVQCDGTTWHIIARSMFSRWEEVELSISNFTPNDATGQMRRVGESLEISYQTTHSGAGSGSNVKLDISQSTIFGGGLSIATRPTDGAIQGNGWYTDSSGLHYPLFPISSGTSDFYFRKLNGATIDNIDGDEFIDTADFGFLLSIPIAEWIDTA